MVCFDRANKWRKTSRASTAIVLGTSLAYAQAAKHPTPKLGTPPSPTSVSAPTPSASGTSDASGTPTAPPTLPPIGSAKAPRGVVGYDDGLYIATADDAHRLQLGGRLTARWTLGRSEGLVQSRFSIPTARVSLGGHVFTSNDFELSGELGRGVFELRNAYLDRPLFGARLRVGQFKVPYSRQHLTSLSRMQFADRALTHAFSDADRDLGVSVYGRPERDRSGAEWNVGVFNGGGIDPLSPRRPIKQVAARVGWSSAHVNGYDEADFDGGPLRVAAALGYLGDLSPTDAMVHRFNVDGMLKAYGTALSWAFYLNSRPSPLPQRQLEMGYHAQIGHFLVPRRVEFAARFAQVPEGTRARHEVLAAMNVYRFEHKLKWQLEGGSFHTSGANVFDWLVRLQMQVVL
jgi:phosphate-selective porin OprO and OprP